MILRIFSILFVSGCVICAPTHGQFSGRSELPSSEYFNAFGEFNAAEYQDAFRDFSRGNPLKIGPNERFMDSACYWTMAAECQFHLGNYAQALALYEQAINLTQQYAQGDWQSRFIRLPLINRSTSAVQKARINWYQTQRGGDNVATIPRFSMLFGKLDAARAIIEGGAVQSPEARTVFHGEIMRCVALAIYRRYTIRGITSHVDPNTARMIADLGRLPTQQPIIGKWNLVVQGLADMSAGRNPQAAQKLQSALKFSNGLDHQLTPLALLALAKIAFQEGNPKSAAQLALEASYSAAVFEQYDLVEDALAFGSLVHLSKSKSVYPPLVNAIQWTGFNRRARLAQTSLLIRLADGFVEANDVAQASQTLDRARRSMSRTDLGRSKLMGQIIYLRAAIAYMSGNDGQADLSQAIAQLQNSSLWLFRLQLVDNSLAAGSITQRQAELSYERLLLDPVSGHWSTSPMETMAYTTTPHVGAMQRWFEILVARKNHEKAINVSERIRRHRFYEGLPFGGRLMALRWMLTAPADLLSANSINQRQDFYNRFPQFAESVEQIDNIQEQLEKLPLKPDEDSPEHTQRRDLLVQLLKLSNFQEATIRSVALKRQAADFVFPAPIDFSGISKALQPHQVVISSLQTASGYHQYAITQNTRRYLGVIRERDMRRGISKLYKSLGITDANGTVESSVLTSDEWKKPAAALKELVFENYHDDQWSNFQEAIIVPDGLLWYLPFEILQTGTDANDWANLNESIKMRYLPMISMITNSKRLSKGDTRLAVVTGKIHLKAELELTQRGFEELSDSLTNAVQFNRQTKIPSNLTNTVTDTMLVWHDMKAESKSGPFGLTPFFLDKGREGSTLGTWLRSPWAGCERVVLPAFSSLAAAGIKSKSNGSDLFYTTCGLMAAGTRSVLISRWRAGGENSIGLSTQFVVDSKSMSTVEALESSCKAAREKELTLENEIRIKPSRGLQGTFKADHPFFWAGNMLVDLHGFTPQDPPDADVVNNDADGSDDDADDTDADDSDTDEQEEELGDILSGSGTTQPIKETEPAAGGSNSKDKNESKEEQPSESKEGQPSKGSGSKLP